MDASSCEINIKSSYFSLAFTIAQRRSSGTAAAMRAIPFLGDAINAGQR